MPHFTYEPKNSDCLYQGDVIKRTSALDSILKEVHPHYFKHLEYKFFIVLTQSCDLVRRNGENPSSRYISIAAVRSFRLAIQREANRLLRSEIDFKLGICDNSRKAKLEQFVERLLNNNEAEYFFLFREPLFGLSEDHCAFLKLSIALKSDLHYQTLLDAKILQLKETFRHKLGYLTGNSYSRIGTEDWLPDHIGEKAWKEKIKESVDLVDSINFFEKNTYNYLVKRAKDLSPDQLSYEILERLLGELKLVKEKKKKDLADSVGSILEGIGIDTEKITKTKKRIVSDPQIISLIR